MLPRDQNEYAHDAIGPAVPSEVLFESRLLNDLEDADDPLQLFLDYIQFLTAKGSSPSLVTSITERCLNYILSIQTYQNDPRFLDLWISYVHSFKSDRKKQLAVYKFMFRHHVGLKLSKFYETFAELLTSIGETKLASLVFERGIAENAWPYRRLVRHSEEFKQLFSLDPSSVLAGGSDLMQFINEKDDTYDDTLGFITINNPDTKIVKDISKTNQSFDKVFKIVQHEGRKPEKIACNFDLIYPADHGVEYNFEQILAISRNVYYKRNNITKREVKRKHKDIFRDIDEDSNTTNQSGHYEASEHSSMVKRRDKSLKTAPISQERNSEQLLFSKPSKVLKRPKVLTPVSSEVRAMETGTDALKAMHYSSVTTTSILPLKDESDDSHRLPVKNIGSLEDDQESDIDNIPGSPMVTAFSKDAMKDVYSMFNQNPDPDDLDNVYSSNHTVTNYDTTRNFMLSLGDEGFTQEFTRQSIGDLTEVKTEIVPKNVPLDLRISGGMSPVKSHLVPPSENPLGQSVSQNTAAQTQDPSQIDSTQRKTTSEARANEYIVEHPLSASLRLKLLANLSPPLDRYDTFYKYDQALNMSLFLGKMQRLSANENKSPIIDFKKTNDLYCIRLELGRGGYATVYLAESGTNEYKALKVEKPASSWEYYILKQVERRLLQLDPSGSSLRSIINVDALHYFTDESYLVLNYAKQGTLLDLVNLIREDNPNTALDETLAMFFSIELIKVVGNIHAIGIIHGDLKADNVMVRFQELSPDTRGLGPYDASGQNGWSSKGIYLIDFGKSLDLNLFPQGRGTKFMADWKVDSQDCLEMQRGEPWSFEADYFGLAGIIHILLFGEAIEVLPLRNTSREYKLRNTLKRYWQRDIWHRLFDVLINSGSDKFGDSSTAEVLSAITQEMVAHLSTKQNSNRLIRVIGEIEMELNSSRVEGSRRNKKR